MRRMGQVDSPGLTRWLIGYCPEVPNAQWSDAKRLGLLPAGLGVPLSTTWRIGVTRNVFWREAPGFRRTQIRVCFPIEGPVLFSHSTPVWLSDAGQLTKCWTANITTRGTGFEPAQ